MLDSVFYRFNEYPEICNEKSEVNDKSEDNNNNRDESQIHETGRILFDPIEILFEDYDKNFIILSSLDYFFNFTQTLGSVLSPQEIDENFHAFNLSSKRGYSEYILYRRPAGFVFEFFTEDHRSFQRVPFLKNENLQIFSKIETFTDFRKIGQFPDIIILEDLFFKFFDMDLMKKLVDMMRTLKYNTGVSFFILDLDFRFKIFEYLSYIELLFSKTSEIYFTIPPGVPFYERKYFLTFVFRPQTEKQSFDFSEFPKWLEKMLTLRKNPNFDLFPYKYRVNWNILTNPVNKTKHYKS